MRPVAAGGVVTLSDVGPAAVTLASNEFTLTAFEMGSGSKLFPLTVNVVPGTPTDGENDAMAGAVDPTLNGVELDAVPDGVVTEITPVAAPGGTLTTSSVVEALVMEAVVPLNLTVSWLDVELNPVPSIVTCVPTAP
jgi:hypothetical protein